MKRLLAYFFIVLSFNLTFNNNSLAKGDYYLKGTKPATLMESGYELFSVVPYVEEGEYTLIIYTFVKDKNIVSCKVRLASSSHKPRKKHKCYNITGLDE